jgi:hypothetical protein
MLGLRDPVPYTGNKDNAATLTLPAIALTFGALFFLKNSLKKKRNIEGVILQF